MTQVQKYQTSHTRKAKLRELTGFCLDQPDQRFPVKNPLLDRLPLNLLKQQSKTKARGSRANQLLAARQGLQNPNLQRGLVWLLAGLLAFISNDAVLAGGHHEIALPVEILDPVIVTSRPLSFLEQFQADFRIYWNSANTILAISTTLILTQFILIVQSQRLVQVNKSISIQLPREEVSSVLEELGLGHGDYDINNMQIDVDGTISLIDADGFITDDPSIPKPNTTGHRRMQARSKTNRWTLLKSGWKLGLRSHHMV